MTVPVRAAAIAAAMTAAALAATGLPAFASARKWMSEEAMRKDFVGKTLDGHYGNGVTWTETYDGAGKLDYKESQRRATGYWYFRGPVFCTFYDPAYRSLFNGGCWVVRKTSANCYEFYLAPGRYGRPGDEADDEAEGERRIAHWNARGWRKEEPSTCEDKPSV